MVPERGVIVPKTTRTRESHSMTLEPAVWVALEKLAKAEDRSTSNVANLLIKEGLESRGMMTKGG